MYILWRFQDFGVLVQFIQQAQEYDLFCKDVMVVEYCVSFQFIQQAIRKDVSKVEEILMPPDGQDEGVWKYEHLR